jgi:hypothetical protein
MGRLRALAFVIALLMTVPASIAEASGSQQAMLQDDVSLMANPAGTLARLRLLGVQRIRLSVHWNYIAPAPGSPRPPRRFDAADPAGYPTANWQIWDQIVTDAQQDGIEVDLDVMGGAPRWAQGAGAPRANTNANWEPSASMYRQFVHALGVRYSGDYDPIRRRLVRDSADLPRVTFWSIWNEPDYGPSLAPQGVPGALTIENSPRMYRNLVDAAWTALHETGHGHDTFLFGELAPRGYNYWGVYSGMKPLVFLRAMYCVNATYRPLTGAAAAIRGCPSTRAGIRRFRVLNPGLFAASGVSDHPYMRWYPPGAEQQPDPAYSSLGEIGNLGQALDRLQRVYGSQRRLPIWDTEFGYITSPPKHDNQYEPSQPHYPPWVSPGRAALYLNWAEYISWRNPRVASFFQYLLHDPLPSLRANDWGGFASGLLNYNNTAKATYAAWRLPVFLPVTAAARRRPLEIWGCLRPARYAILDTGLPQSVAVQFAPRRAGSFTTLRTVTISQPGASCYFDLHLRLPGSGTLRLSWSYPLDDQRLGSFGPRSARTIYSRRVQVTLH